MSGGRKALPYTGIGGPGFWQWATALIIIMPAVTDSMSGASAGVGFYDRLSLFVFIALYGSAAVAVFDAFWPRALEPEPVVATA